MSKYIVSVKKSKTSKSPTKDAKTKENKPLKPISNKASKISVNTKNQKSVSKPMIKTIKKNSGLPLSSKQTPATTNRVLVAPSSSLPSVSSLRVANSSEPVGLSKPSGIKKMGFRSNKIDNTESTKKNKDDKEGLDKWLSKPVRRSEPPVSQTDIRTVRVNRDQGLHSSNYSLSSSSSLYQNNQSDLIQTSLKPRKRELGSRIEQKNSEINPINSDFEADELSVPQPKQRSESEPFGIPNVQANNQLINDCINIMIQCDPDQACSKDELISRIAYQRNLQLKQNGGVRNQMVIAMEKLLSDLKNEQMDKGMKNLNQTRKEQDKIVLDNEMDENVYKMKIDMTLPENKRKKGDDPHCVIFSESKKWWNKESKKNYTPPPKIEAAFKKNPGNKALPRDMAKQLLGY